MSQNLNLDALDKDGWGRRGRERERKREREREREKAGFSSTAYARSQALTCSALQLAS